MYRLISYLEFELYICEISYLLFGEIRIFNEKKNALEYAFFNQIN